MTERIEYRGVVDKTNWPRGEWDSEPDKLQWQDEETGLACLIVRGPVGALCGYVGLPPGHALYGRSYNELDVSVHGGLTFGDKCASHGEAAWERFKACEPQARKEASRYPQGTAARWLARAEASGALESFEAFQHLCEATLICHKPVPGEPDTVFWLGFDCAHAGDFAPGAYLRLPSFFGKDSTYKNLVYVEAEVKSLARQLAAGGEERHG